MTSTTSTSSATKWIGEVPSGWRVLEPRRVFSLRREPERPGDIHLTPSQKYGVLPQEEYVAITGSQVVRNLSGTTMQHVEAGDFISHLRTFQGGLELAKQAGKVSPAYTVVTPGPEAFPNYYKYVLKSRGYISQIASVTDQLRDGQSMRFPEFNETWLPVPPFEEQKLIADYLDRETAEIDAFISELLKAKELLGYRLKSLANEIIQDTLPKESQQRAGRHGTPDHPFGNDWIQLGALASVGTGSLDTQDATEHGTFPFFVRSDNIELSEYATHHGEAVLTAGDGAGVGKVFHHYRGSFAAHQRVYVIEPGPQLIGRFLYWVLRTYFGDIVLAGTAKSTVESLRRPMLTGFPIPSLSLAEQRRIAGTLDRAHEKIADQLADAQRAIQLAQERRSALISAAVTGQIDVTAQHVSAAEQLKDELEVPL